MISDPRGATWPSQRWWVAFRLCPVSASAYRIAARLADRQSLRAEATVQSDVRLLSLAADLNLREGDLEDVNLEPTL
jgi:hypothetical protein